MDLDEKAEQHKLYHDQIKDLVIGKKTRITIKKRPKKAESSKKIDKKDEIVENKVESSKPDDNDIKDKSSKKMEERLNENLITIFDELAGFMVKRGEPFKARAYQKAQESIVMYPNDITKENYKQLEKLSGIGDTITEKIDEYIKTGTLRILERERADPHNIFTDIYGVGPKKAEEIIKKGVTTIDELRKNKDEYLNAIQKVGLKYYEDILQRIPRSEIDEYNKMFNKTFEQTKDVDTKYEIVGSYRRNAMSSGDIDVIITSKNKDVFKRFVDYLLEQGIILEILSRGQTKCLVIAKLSNKPNARRVDFLYTTPEEYPFAVLYFTGSKIFNTVMRGRALSMGYSLNEHGMYKMDGKKKGEKVEQEFSNERSIFSFLKMKYKEPEDRKDGRSVVQESNNESNENINIKYTINEESKSKNKTRKSTEEKVANKEIERIEKERIKQLQRDRKESEKRSQKEEKERIKLLKKTQKEDTKKANKKEKTDSTKTRKNRKTKIMKSADDVKIDENIIKTNEDIKEIPKMIDNKTEMKSVEDDPIIRVIQQFKDGGIHVLEKLNEATLNGMLIKTNEVYRNLGPDESPLITDNQYDILEDYIKQKYPKNTIVGKIGAPVEKNKVKLPYEMASMDKIKPDTKALSSWKSKYKGDYIISCKLDGVSGLYSTENKTSKLYTRGDGKTGQDISHLLESLKLPTKSGIVVRGEFIMSKSTFNKKYSDKFANGRNLVAGTVNRLSVNDTVQDMDFVAYEVIKPPLKPSEQMKFLLDNGFKTVRHESHKDITNEQLSEILVDWRSNYEYEIDGLIVSNNQIYPRTSGNPDHSFAFKMVLSEQMAETKVLDVEWNASKDGYLKPRVRMEPVKLSGVKIEYATGFNGAFIETNKIGVGALIQIIRSGDVIPYIKSVITPADKGLMPTVPYIWNEKHVDVMLENKEDDHTVREKNITGFFKGIGVDGLGGGNITRIIDAGFDSIPKILKMSKNDLLTVEGFKDKMAEKIYNGIRENIEKASLINIMSASNTIGRGFSEKKIELIMIEYPDILTSSEDNESKIKKLSKIKGLASKTAETFVYNIPFFIKFMEECGLMSKINRVIEKPALSDSDNPLYKKSIVMSGVRDKELETFLKSVGANLSSGVSSNTFALITSDIEGGTSKIEAAKKHGIQILTPDSFRKKYII